MNRAPSSSAVPLHSEAVPTPAATEHIDAKHRLEMVCEVVLSHEAATQTLGNDLALAFAPGDVVALLGDLGAGKSTLARAAIRTLADDGALEVPSPTYTLVQSYETAPPVAHFDLYRVAGDGELDELGFDDAAHDGIALVEWPQNAASVLATATIEIALASPPTGAGRTATIRATRKATERLERSFAIRAFLRDAGHGEAMRRRFTGDASTRRYETIATSSGTRIVMDAPRQPDGPPVRDGLPYSRIAHLAEDVLPFVAVGRALSEKGFAAPAIHRADFNAGLVLLDHLGEETLLDEAGAPRPARYEAAVSCLAELHAISWPDALDAEPGRPHQLSAFDRRAMGMEVDLLIDWYLPRQKGRAATNDERSLFMEIWAELFDELRAAETSLVLRDFHSPNVIWRPEASGRARIGIIDFQDAVIGPTAYDVASLAQDARVDVSGELEARLLTRYVAARRASNAGFDAFGFERDYAIMAAQRSSKILGIFVRLLERDGKPQYLRHIPRIKGYLARTLGHPSLAALRSLYGDWGVLDDEPVPCAISDRLQQTKSP